MSEVATLPMERRRGTERRQPSRLQRTELGRVRSMVRALAATDREGRDDLERRLIELQREVDRLLQQAGLEPLPPIDDEP